MSSAQTTTDHDAIRKWVEERGGTPSKVSATSSGQDDGILRIDFAEPEESLAPVSWEEFFTIFEENGLAFLHQDKTEDGSTSRFFKFVARESSG